MKTAVFSQCPIDLTRSPVIALHCCAAAALGTVPIVANVPTLLTGTRHNCACSQAVGWWRPSVSNLIRLSLDVEIDTQPYLRLLSH